MLNFFKENSYSIFKMIINQIGITMFGLMLSMATQANSTLFLISSIFSVLFYLFLLYTMTWEIGYGEKIRIEAKRLKYSPFKGLFMSMYANVINFILAVLIIIGYYSSTIINSMPVSPEWSVNLFGTSKTIAAFLEAMYAGIIGSFFPYTPWIYLLIIVPSLLTCFAGYIVGVKGKRITKLLGPNESKE